MKRLVGLIAFGVVLHGWACPGALAAGTAPSPAAESTIVSDVLKRINIERNARSLPDVTVNAEFQNRAQAWADHEAATGAYGHSGNPGAEIITVMGTSADVVYNFMTSTDHRNILLGQYSDVGVGIGCDSQGKGYVVAQFTGFYGSGPNPQTSQDPVASTNVSPNYQCAQAAPPTTQKPPTTTQPTSPPTTQKPPTTTQPTTATTAKPTETTQPSSGTTPSTARPETTTTASPVSAPPPPPPLAPVASGQASVVIAPAVSVVGSAVSVAVAGWCPTSGTHSLAVLDAAGRVVVAKSTGRQSFGGRSAVHLLVPAEAPEGQLTVALVCADDTTASAAHIRRPAGPASSSTPGSAGSSSSSPTDPGAAPPTSSTPVSIDVDAVRNSARQPTPVPAGRSNPLPYFAGLAVVALVSGFAIMRYRRT